MEDAAWIHRHGWRPAVEAFIGGGNSVLGICGGYQLMGEEIQDPHGVESSRTCIDGLGILPVRTVLEKEKVVRRVMGRCLITGQRVFGYEIHMGGTSPTREQGSPLIEIHEPGSRRRCLDGWSVQDGLATGTYVHGVLDAPGFRGAFLNAIRRKKGLPERRPGPGRRARFHQYDRLADHFEAHCDVGRILEMLQI